MGLHAKNSPWHLYSFKHDLNWRSDKFNFEHSKNGATDKLKLRIEDEIGNSVTIIGGWYVRFTQHPEQWQRCLEIIKWEAANLVRKAERILRENNRTDKA